MAEEEIIKIQKVSPETRNAVARKSAQTLPNRPSEQGYSADEIKRRFYQPILDAANSALAEIDRVVDEANNLVVGVNGKLDEFIDGSQLNAPHKEDLGDNIWVFNEVEKMYEHLITKAAHGIEDYKEICVEMFLFGEGGKLVNCNNYNIYANGDVRLYNENTGGGFVAISRNREGFVKVDTVINVDNVLNLAKVGQTNDYNDLNNLPSLSQIPRNEEAIAKIISGAQQVMNAKNAETADKASYATDAANATNAVNAQAAIRATQDGNGANIANTYAKQSGTYSNITAGRTYGDEDGSNIKATYAKQNGTYSGMSVGKATNADSATNAANATNATNATKATQDGNGANIANTYAKKSEVDYESIAKKLHPVGSILISTKDVNPQTYITGTTWVAWGQGRVPLGVGTSEANNDGTGTKPSNYAAVGIMGGSEASVAVHTHSIKHVHRINAVASANKVMYLYGKRMTEEEPGPLLGCMLDGRKSSGTSGLTGYSYNRNLSNKFTTDSIDNRVSRSTADDNYADEVELTHFHTIKHDTGTTASGNAPSSGSSNVDTNTSGEAGSVKGNMQPYITCYMWLRTT